jgi:hypothetical protein
MSERDLTNMVAVRQNYQQLELSSIQYTLVWLLLTIMLFQELFLRRYLDITKYERLAETPR